MFRDGGLKTGGSRLGVALGIGLCGWLGVGVCGGAAAGGASSWVMISGGLCGVIIGNTTTASTGYTTISCQGSSSSNGMSSTLGGFDASTFVVRATSTLGGRDAVPTCWYGSCCTRRGCGFCCSSCSGGGAEVSLILSNLFSFAASWNMTSRRWVACIVVLDMLGCIWVGGDSAILTAAIMMASVGVTDGFVIYLCLKNTVSETCFLLFT